MVPHPYVPFPKAINATFHGIQEGKWLPILVTKAYQPWKDHKQKWKRPYNNIKPRFKNSKFNLIIQLTKIRVLY
jgi:hypothetical protein